MQQFRSTMRPPPKGIFKLWTVLEAYSATVLRLAFNAATHFWDRVAVRGEALFALGVSGRAGTRESREAYLRNAVTKIAGLEKQMGLQSAYGGYDGEPRGASDTAS